jgi:hypothetical protein
MKLLCGVMALACVPVTIAGNNVAYPKENVAEFVVEKLDVTTLPSAIRPKPEERKKTFGDYGYVVRQLDETEAVVEATAGRSPITSRFWSKSRLEFMFASKAGGRMQPASKFSECSC